MRGIVLLRLRYDGPSSIESMLRGLKEKIGVVNDSR